MEIEFEVESDIGIRSVISSGNDIYFEVGSKGLGSYRLAAVDSSMSNPFRTAKTLFSRFNV